ncbi:putative DNA modification/repair radical SAM protein [Pseudomonas syringae]
MQLIDKLSILADAAKYDASCASSGAPKRSSQDKSGLGSTNGMGICHSYTPDGRCVSLLKILLTNFCLYDCQYCVNRRSSDVPRARFSPEEVVTLTLDFYRRNCVSGLFLSSGIIRSADYTMEQLVEVARLLREVHEFRGYIHLKTIPDADPALIEKAGRYADRLSVNIELPTDLSLQTLAPEKDVASIKQAMQTIYTGEQTVRNEPRSPRFAPAGQSTQMIVGADATDDSTILHSAQSLYSNFKLRRVYYSAFSPIPNSPNSVPLAAPPLMREHRLYQADFLLRGYGFTAGELLDGPGDLALDIDPKLAWALGNRQVFPLDLNQATRH